MTGPKAIPDEKKAGRKRAARRTLLTGLLFIAGFIVLGVLAIQVWEYSNSVPFAPTSATTCTPKKLWPLLIRTTPASSAPNATWAGWAPSAASS